MSPTASRPSVRQWLRREWTHLSTLQTSRRPWQMPIAAALCCGVPLWLGAWLGMLSLAFTATLGGLVFIYLPNTNLKHRMMMLAGCAIGMSVCFALGLLSHPFAHWLAPLLACLTVLVTLIGRRFGIGPPGSLFFIMAAAIGAFVPSSTVSITGQVGVMFMGSLLAMLIALPYSLLTLRNQPAEPASRTAAAGSELLVDATIIGLFVGLSLGIAQALSLEKPYWVPISCLAVVQGSSLRMVWNRQLHRVLGTVLGMAVAWCLLSLPLDAWRIAALITLLTALIELLIVRHYALAVAFITPLTILLADAAALGQIPAVTLIQARMVDTLLGCLIGLAGGLCLHRPTLRAWFSRPLSTLLQRRTMLDP